MKVSADEGGEIPRESKITARLFLQFALDRLDLFGERPVIADEAFDLADSVQHGGVIAFAEAPPCLNYPCRTPPPISGNLAFAQLTFRESLRDIEVCLRAHEAKLYHLGIRGHVARSNLGDANEKRDWRIYRDFANSLIAQARRLYADDAFAVDLDNTVYALDTTTIDLSLKVFPWAHFRKAKAAVKMYTQLICAVTFPRLSTFPTAKCMR